MLSIKLNNSLIGYVWHVGEKNPVPYEKVIAVTEVQADGDELEHIEDMFQLNKQIPIPRRRVVRWFGDHAKLIVGNLT